MISWNFLVLVKARFLNLVRLMIPESKAYPIYFFSFFVFVILHRLLPGKFTGCIEID